MLDQARALLVGAGARAFFFARDVRAARTLDAPVREAWRALRALPPAHRTSFEAVRRAREAGLPAEALTFGDTPLSVALTLLGAAGVGQGAVVVDPLAGRGAVLLAARALGAQARGVELDGAHVDLAAPLVARAGAQLAQGDARTHDYAGATCVYLAWTCLDAPTRAAVVDRIVQRCASGARIVALTWPPTHAHVVVEREERAWFPWGRVDVVTATAR
jgi:hypothetical protein